MAWKRSGVRFPSAPPRSPSSGAFCPSRLVAGAVTGDQRGDQRGLSELECLLGCSWPRRSARWGRRAVADRSFLLSCGFARRLLASGGPPKGLDAALGEWARWDRREQQAVVGDDGAGDANAGEDGESDRVARGAEAGGAGEQEWGDGAGDGAPGCALAAPRPYTSGSSRLDRTSGRKRVVVPWPMPRRATAAHAVAAPLEVASRTMPPTGTKSTSRARRAGATRSAKRPNTTRAATWVAPMSPAAMAAWRSVQPWSVR